MSKEIKKDIETKEKVVEEETTTATEKVVAAPKKLTKEELKDKFRKADMAYKGRLFIDDKYKSPDKVLRIDNDDAATRAYLANLGYVPVRDHVQVGSGSLNESHSMGSEVHIEQGVTSSQPGILYEIDKDMYDARKEVEQENNDKQLQNRIEADEAPSAKMQRQMREQYGH